MGGTAALGCGHRAPTYFSSFIFLQTSVVCPVLESIRVVTARQLHVTVLAFSCLTTTQCSTVSAVSGGARLRIGGGVGPAVTGFFGPHPDRIRQATLKPATRETPSQAVLMPSVFALSRPLVDGNLDYRPSTPWWVIMPFSRTTESNNRRSKCVYPERRYGSSASP
jgi:hypothetical protein